MEEDEPPDRCKVCGRSGTFESGLCPICSSLKMEIKKYMVDKYSPTWISDNFPMKKLECQYYQVCSEYIPDDCPFDSPCAVRLKLRDLLEDYVATECLHDQIELILDE